MGLKYVLCALSLFSLVACGSGTAEPTVGAAVLGGLLKGRQKAAPVAITRQAIAGAPGPVLLIDIPSRKAQGTLILVQNNGSVATYISADGVGFNIRNNTLVVGTRGLGADLMASDISGLPDALRTGAGSFVKTMQFLNGEDQIVTNKFSCVVTTEGSERIDVLGQSYATRRMREDCSDSTLSFANKYWVSDNEVWRSFQWISAAIGTIKVEKLQ